MTDLPIALTDELRTKMLDLYRHLHANPELSMQEHKTAELIQSSLVALGIDTFVCGGTGVVGVLTNGEGPTVAFRADSDGLPIAEDTGVDYASAATGRLDDGTEVPVMHGCGHDTHVATLLTVAELLAGAREAWAGTIVFLFQPGEETAAGAKAMVEDGLWDRAPKPEIVFGQHVGPMLAGTVHVTSGDAMAMADSLKVTVYGQGSHGSQPQDSIDPIIQGVNMINRIQTIVSREVHPMKPAVVTVATFHAGLKENIIADRAEFTINVRTLDPEVREQVNAALRRIIYAEAAASGAPKPLIEELYTFPRNYNDPDATAELVAELQKVLGENNVTPSSPMMGSEDFGLLAEAIGVPSVFWMFGGHTAETLESGKPVPVNHSPFFAPVAEPTLSTGVQAAMTAILSKVGI
ncbi:peptidase [Rhodococcus opacus PD630]|uniref:amidohydrolase n=1 Tax=Rhodococcus TaxID=1827 RepID=UPI00029CD21A|nr:MULTISPECIES: amidohydrolase [Rhodococcus]KXF48783.1 amidohydrolase [Rhodococcus sp. SC4]RZK71816.1 MAG: amidohydrolase [Rhodococcus sp. (in: high G+C Gram-positive bacteria)]AHK34342.1 Thermostable carboxypeptidase 2 [Rhodococcus opacus PD630]EHI39749.1 peptidase [Rhodococcus opacus PD630]KXX61980.1 amidohydrolase [Rhodococcus sp. LB1]